jgi:hypothetical protein
MGAGDDGDGENVPRGIVIPDGDGGEKRSSPRARTWSWAGARAGIWIPHLLQKSLVADSCPAGQTGICLYTPPSESVAARARGPCVPGVIWDHRWPGCARGGIRCAMTPFRPLAVGMA